MLWFLKDKPVPTRRYQRDNELEIKENRSHLESKFAGTFQCDKQVKVHLKIRLEKKDQQQRDC